SYSIEITGSTLVDINETLNL
ncbi:hypothetical protein, partial [Mycobacterium tuberculosis]